MAYALTIKYLQIDVIQLVADEEGYSMKSSKLHLIDLAGSERANATGETKHLWKITSLASILHVPSSFFCPRLQYIYNVHTGATGTRLKEGAMINKSLSALGNAISN